MSPGTRVACRALRQVNPETGWGGSDVPIPGGTCQITKGTLSGAFLGSRARIRTTDRRVMSSNPISYAVDRRATHLRVTFRSLVAESPAHCELVLRRLYLGVSSCQTCSALVGRALASIA